MTSQIAILNKQGVALATDSAVTISSQSGHKVYNSANKLFSLSDKNPIALMIYSNAEFMGIPWEIIIKEYRKKDNNFGTLEEYTVDFQRYLMTEDNLIQSYAFHETIYKKFINDLDIIFNEVNRDLSKINEVHTEELVVNVFENTIDQIYNNISNMQTDNNFIDEDKDEIFQNYEEQLDEIIGHQLNIGLTSEYIDKLKVILVTLVIKEIQTTYTGLVFAGYGENEIYPRLFDFHVEGIFNRKLKINLEIVQTIGSTTTESTVTAAIVPFAQTDMIDTFMQGSDPSLKNTIYSSFENILRGHYPELIENLLETNLDENQRKLIDDASIEILANMRGEIEQFSQFNYLMPVIETINLMPKEEMANIAETLINLASLKKRVTMVVENVGGPVDVAIVSKNDGFIWINRKHYFDPNLNHRFFNKK